VPQPECGPLAYLVSIEPLPVLEEHTHQSRRFASPDGGGAARLERPFSQDNRNDVLKFFASNFRLVSLFLFFSLEHQGEDHPAPGNRQEPFQL
jgi:hypothetical protein